MTFILILELQNIIHVVLKLFRKVTLDMERDEKNLKVRKVILSLAEKEDEAEKTQKNKDEVIKRYMLKA